MQFVTMRIQRWHWILTLYALFSLVAAFGATFGLQQEKRFLKGFDQDISYHDYDGDATGLDRYSDNSNSTGILDSNHIYEWTPISTNISAGQRDVFTFSVESLSSSPKKLSTFEVMIFLSGNICNQPTDTTDKLLRVTYSFDEIILSNSSMGECAYFTNGYMQALATCPLKDISNGSVAAYPYLYVVVEAVNVTTNEILPLGAEALNDVWHYEMTVSENDLVYQWDSRQSLDILDTDHNSALVATDRGLSILSYLNGVKEDTVNNSVPIDSSLYDIYLYSEEEASKIEDSLKLSLCAVTSGSYLATSANKNYTGDRDYRTSLDNLDLEIIKSPANRTWHYQEQFYITGLNSSSSYTVYLTKKIGRAGNLSQVGGVLFSKSTFSTRNSNDCSLIFGLDFCSGVAYSVPNSASQPNNKTFLAEQFDNLAKSSYVGFSKALQNIPCNIELDAKYSPLRTCDDCAHSYKNWLCAVTIPRCSAEASDIYKRRDKDKNRSHFLSESFRASADYYEILPCVEMCYSLVRDCPSEFQFSCPDSLVHKDLFHMSYNFFDPYSNIMTCNFIGNDTDIFISLFNAQKDEG